MKQTIPVLEIFGPTFQGEGMVIGQKTMFVRTAGCDYSCSWCDSAFTWDGSAKQDIRQLTAQQIWDEFVALGGDSFSHITISGGNPALIKAMGTLIDLAHAKGVRVGVETQGSRWQDWLNDVDDLTISPKPPSSNMVTNYAILDETIATLRATSKGTFTLKVVVFNDEDYDYAKAIHHRYPDVPFFLQVGNDDIETTDDQSLIMHLLGKYEWLLNKVSTDHEMNNVRPLPQLHTLVWGNKRGV